MKTKTLETVSTVVARFGMTAALKGDTVEIRKGAKLAAVVGADGMVDRKYEGRQALMGAFGAQQIEAALKASR